MKLAAAFLAGSVCGLWVWSRIVLRVERQFPTTTIFDEVHIWGGTHTDDFPQWTYTSGTPIT